ncbi:MAG: hypothetical protein ACTSXO_10850 [Candidatus Heimdallarchaeota archaeon]|nr:MAG: hypothetical protein DRP02_06560 [Candidatus Gerdarchaeota archaeon]
MPPRITTSEKKDKSFSKVITIRGIDKLLFEQFVSLTRSWGKNTGEIFSTILSNFLQSGGGSHIYLPALEKRLEGNLFKHLEIIEDLDELFINYEDLSSVPQGVKFYFNNIKKLIFAEDINAQVLQEYVYRIKNCLVQQPRRVKKLVFLSLLQNYPEYSTNGRELKDVTIRNVKEQTWSNFKAFCQMHNSNVGTLLNHILWEIIPEMEITQILFSKLKNSQMNTLLISSQQEVVINKADLLEIAPQHVLFHRIKKLTFQEDISSELFVERVKGIYNCSSVKFPKQFSKLLKLSRVKYYP